MDGPQMNDEQPQGNAPNPHKHVLTAAEPHKGDKKSAPHRGHH